MKKALVYGFGLVMAGRALALDPAVENIEAVCALVKKGEATSIRFEGTGETKGLVKIVAAGLKGKVELTHEQHTGLQRVLQSDQVKDYANYRTCAVDMIPYFKAKMETVPNPPRQKTIPQATTNGKNSPIIIGDGATIHY